MSNVQSDPLDVDQVDVELLEYPNEIAEDDRELRDKIRLLKQTMLIERCQYVQAVNRKRCEEAELRRQMSSSYALMFQTCKHFLKCALDVKGDLLQFWVPLDKAKNLTGNEALAQLDPRLRMCNEYAGNNPINLALIHDIMYDVEGESVLAGIIERKTPDRFYRWLSLASRRE